MNRILALLLAATGAIALPAAASAATVSCTASTADVVFGSYNPLATTATTAAGTVTVSCGLVNGASLLVGYTVTLSKGAGSFTARSLVSGGNVLSYNLYTSSNYTSVWGDGTASTGTISDGYLIAVGTVVKSYPVYGRMAALQPNPAAGTYGDSIIVTVSY